MQPRAGLSFAVGLSVSIAGCPPAQAPSGAPPDAALATANDAGSVAAAGDAPASVDGSTPPVDAPETTDAPDAGSSATKPKKLLPQLPATAFDVDYPMKHPPPNCKEGWATCVPQAWAIEKHGSPGDTKCPDSISVVCRCPAGIPNCNGGLLGPEYEREWPCGASLLPLVTATQRGAGKKDACCYERELHCTPSGA